VTVSLEFNNIDTQAPSYVSDTIVLNTENVGFSGMSVIVDGVDISAAG